MPKGSFRQELWLCSGNKHTRKKTMDIVERESGRVLNGERKGEMTEQNFFADAAEGAMEGAVGLAASIKAGTEDFVERGVLPALELFFDGDKTSTRPEDNKARGFDSTALKSVKSSTMPEAQLPEVPRK